MNRLGRHLGVFVAVLVVVLAVAAVAPALLGSSGGTSVSGQSPEQYQPSNLQFEPIEESGSITVERPAGTKTVAIDLAHSNDITREDVTPLVSALVDAGHEVRFVGGETSSRTSADSEFGTTLQDVDAYVVAAPSTPFTTEQVDAVEAYAEADGRVLVLEDKPSSGITSMAGLVVSVGSSGVESQADHLGSRFDVAFGTSYLYDMTTDNANFKAVTANPATESGLLEGVEEVVFREAVPVRTGGDADALLTTTPSTTLESTRESGDYTVLARNDNVVAVGDMSFLSPDSYREADNEVLIGNLATFLVSGEKDPNAPSTGPSGDRSPSERPGPTTPEPGDNATEQPASETLRAAAT
ncbi:motility-associated ABC transporter substrate-binding family protein [Halorhabdus amylolytica]|uniref:hypothetical protein n=1 Tax=Halorhabdus amylolytica TaxID=2559573 RepID=UPI0010AA46AF|nr:hypothetical protein [Halorhabdus amylolytica]